MTYQIQTIADFREFTKEVCYERNMTLQDMCDRASVSQRVYGRMHKRKRISIEEVARVADALGYEILLVKKD